MQVYYQLQFLGVEVCPVQVEADVSNGLPSFIMVGFPSAQVKEAQERVRTALKNNGYQFPPKRITVNFAPADMKKEGAGFDVPVAAAVLAAFEMISPQVVSRVMMAGEIGLDGEIHGISGILPIVLCARSLGSRFCVVPYENLKEGRLIRDVPVAGVKNLRELVECLKNPEPYLKRGNTGRNSFYYKYRYIQYNIKLSAKQLLFLLNCLKRFLQLIILIMGDLVFILIQQAGIQRNLYIRFDSCFV